jgi:glyoxylase-like metal-dependent hydrolase (beta-lactamase superfamily II)
VTDVGGLRQGVGMDWRICATCGVESSRAVDVCPICDDERQWVPAAGQVWTSLKELQRDDHQVELRELEPDLFGLTVTPGVGIAQQSKVVRTPDGLLLWDPIGYVDEEAARAVLALGPVVAVAASHPHMYGVQVEWSRALGAVPVLVSQADAHWVQRPDDAIETWQGEREVLPGVVLSQPGGHFPGSAVVHWAAGADGRGVLLSGDTIFANADRTSVSFMRSFPNHLPLSGAVALRIAEHVARRPFERLYNNFQGVVPADARDVVLRSAQRHAEWTRGDHDDLT